MKEITTHLNLLITTVKEIIKKLKTVRALTKTAWQGLLFILSPHEENVKEGKDLTVWELQHSFQSKMMLLQKYNCRRFCNYSTNYSLAHTVCLGNLSVFHTYIQVLQGDGGCVTDKCLSTQKWIKVSRHKGFL